MLTSTEHPRLGWQAEPRHRRTGLTVTFAAQGHLVGDAIDEHVQPRPHQEAEDG